MLRMVSYPHRPQSGHFMCYLNRTYHVLPTSQCVEFDLLSDPAHNAQLPPHPIGVKMQRGKRMWNKNDDPHGGPQPDFALEEKPDLAALGNELVQSLMNDQVKKGNLAVVPQRVLTEDQSSPSPSASMKTYTGAVDEFTKNATAFIEQLPHLTKARAAYEEAMKASAEIRKVLDAEEQNLRTLMTQLERGLSVHDAKPAPDKKSPEPAKADRVGGIAEGARRPVQWP